MTDESDDEVESSVDLPVSEDLKTPTEESKHELIVQGSGALQISSRQNQTFTNAVRQQKDRNWDRSSVSLDNNEVQTLLKEKQVVTAI